MAVDVGHVNGGFLTVFLIAIQPEDITVCRGRSPARIFFGAAFFLTYCHGGAPCDLSAASELSFQDVAEMSSE